MPKLSKQTNNRKKIWGLEILDSKYKPFFIGEADTERQLSKMILDNIPETQTFVITIVKKVGKEEALVSEKMTFSSNEDKNIKGRIDELFFSIKQAIKKYKLTIGGKKL